MKTPISYYGGKQKLVDKIISLIPQHTLYCEPFLVGAAVLFAKKPSKVEVINDTNRELINFYQVIRKDFDALEKEVELSLHSRDQYRQASVIYNHPDMFSPVKRAWAVWMLTSQGFSAMLDSSWGFDISKNTTTLRIKRKKENFTRQMAVRLQNCQIEAADALYIIGSRDSPESFFYCDPPYFNSDCGHYDGYSVEDFDSLLFLLSNIQGKFLLSSYPSSLLQTYTEKHGWYNLSVRQKVSVNAKSGIQKDKIEMLTANYMLGEQGSLIA